MSLVFGLLGVLVLTKTPSDWVFLVFFKHAIVERKLK